MVRGSAGAGVWGARVVEPGQGCAGEGQRKGCWQPGRAGPGWQRSLCPWALSTPSPAPLAEPPSSFTPGRWGSVSSFFLLEALPRPWQVCATGRNLGLPRASGLPLVRRWAAVLPGHHFHLPTIFSKSVRLEHRGRGCSCRPGAAPRPVELGLGDGRGPPFPAVPGNTSLIAWAVLWPVSAADPLLWIRCCQNRVPNLLSGVPSPENRRQPDQ